MAMDPGTARYRLGALSRISAEAIGTPGKRTFKLVLASGAASVSLWLEKEQLFQLATHIQGIISSLMSGSQSSEGEPPDPEWDQGITNLDFKVSKLALGHDSSTNSFLFFAHDVEEQEEESAKVSFWLSRRQGEGLAEGALRVCAAGRPPCVLCGQPIDPEGHMCPRSNGHGPTAALG